MSRRRQIVVMGIMGRTPVAGVAWQLLHYLGGISRLGHEVFYVEDTLMWPYNPETNSDDCTYTLNYINRLMNWCGLGDRWAFHDVSQGNRVYGLSNSRLTQVLEQADALINVTGSTELREKYLRVPVRVYLETDPGVPEIQVAQGDPYTIDFLNAHTHHFTFGENIGRAGCGLPADGYNYQPTRQPIVLDWWRTENCSQRKSGRNASVFTTVSTWQQSNDITWNGETYTWSKDRQFLRFIDLPAKSGQEFELALACDDENALGLLRSHGWRVSDAVPLTRDIFPYRDYITESRAEFTVAKEQYARLATGWFSDRSASYLAAGRPVITQETGFSEFLPTGKGLFGFSMMEDILAAVDEISADYEGNCRAAREIATNYFGASKVLEEMLKGANL
jgi:hypothetical protein